MRENQESLDPKNEAIKLMVSILFGSRMKKSSRDDIYASHGSTTSRQIYKAKLSSQAKQFEATFEWGYLGNSKVNNLQAREKRHAICLYQIVKQQTAPRVSTP